MGKKVPQKMKDPPSLPKSTMTIPDHLHDVRDQRPIVVDLAGVILIIAADPECHMSFLFIKISCVLIGEASGLCDVRYQVSWKATPQ